MTIWNNQADRQEETCGQTSGLPGQGEGMTKQAIVEFFDRLAPGWDASLIVEEDKLNCILDAAGVQSGVKVLDVACGTGVLFPFYLKRDVEEVTAVDISSEMVKVALRKNRDARIRVICGDIEELAPMDAYDCCVIYNAFPHFPNPEALLEGLTKWLKPNGRLTVAHGMSIEKLTRHHSGSASKVSRGLLPASEMAELFGRWFRVDGVVSDDEKYIVSGTLR